ncbi:MAG: ABC transporter transmembrane domain-containing protein [Pseudomonadota bacterium]
MVKIDPAVVAAALLINLLGLAMPLAVLQIYDRIAPQQAIETLFALTLGLLAVALAEFGLRVAQGYLSNLSGGRFGHTLQVLALRRLLASTIEDRATLRTTQTLEQIRAIDKLTGYFGGHPRLALIDLPFSILFIGMIAIIAGPLALAPLVVVAIFMGRVIALGRRNRDLAEARDVQDGRIIDFLGEVLTSGFTVKSFSIEILMLRRFERLLKRSAGLQRQAVALAGDIQRSSAVFGNASMITMIAVGALFVIFGDLSIGGLAACSLLAGRAAQPLLKAANAWHELERATLALDQVGELFQTPSRPISTAGERLARAPAISARALAISHGDRTVFDEADFDIGPGQVAALIGPEMSGRSSLLWAMAGLLTPSAGALQIDGLNAQAHRATVNASVALYTPSLRPLNGTILQNLTLFGRGASVDDARWAARLLGVERAVNLLPEGYDTKLGAGVAETLPSGLIRRILLARAVARQPRLLLLDAPFAYLDDSAEHEVVKALDALKGHVTIAMTLDGAAGLEGVDTILAFGGGRIRQMPPETFLESQSAQTKTVQTKTAAASKTQGGAA